MVSFTIAKASALAVALLSLTAIASPTLETRDYDAEMGGKFGPMVSREVKEAAIARRQAMERRDTPVHCVDDDVNGPKTVGNLLCLDLGSIPPGKRDLQHPHSTRQSGNTYTCDQCLGLNGNTAVVSEEEVSTCYITIGDDSTYGNLTSCPGDPSPSTNPDGSDGESVFGGIMDAYCAVAGSEGLFGWTTFAVCYAYTFSQNNDNTLEENEAGAELLCDTFFLGLCSFLSATTKP